MDCGQADILLVDYLYGELSEPERQAFELHLQSCPVHAKEVERSRAVLSLMRKDSREDPSYRVSKEIVRAAEDSIHRTSRPWGWLGWIRTPIAAAAALLVVIGIGAVVYFNEGFEKRSSENAATVATAQRSSPDSLVGSGAAKPSAVDTLGNVSTPAPKKPVERAKGLDKKAARLSREPISEKPKARDEEIAQDVGVERPSDRAFIPQPEKFQDQSAGSKGVAALRQEPALPAATAAPPRALHKKVFTEEAQAPRSAPAEAIAEKPMGAVSHEELPPLSDSDAALTIRRYMGEFAACARNYASIKGKMVLDITIANNGVVTNVSIPEKFKGTAYADCIVSWVKKILFPKFEGPPKTVSFPLVTR